MWQPAIYICICETCIMIVCRISHSWNASDPSSQRLYLNNRIFENIRLSQHIFCTDMTVGLRDILHMKQTLYFTRSFFMLPSTACSFSLKNSNVRQHWLHVHRNILNTWVIQCSKIPTANKTISNRTLL